MPRDLLEPFSRIRWAIEHSGKTLEQLGEEIGCTHATLSQWQTGDTNIMNVKVRLLVAFARATGTRLDWLLNGDEPRLALPIGRGDPPLVLVARHIAQDFSPATAAVAERLLLALEPDPPTYGP